MKLKNNLITTSVVLSLLSFSCYALKTDYTQPVNITSTEQSMDLEKDVVTFSKNVVITQGSILIHANEVRIEKNKNQKEIIYAYGNPITFYQKLDNGKPANAKAKQFVYNTESNLITLTGDAELKQLDSQINADMIVYDTSSQKIKATSNKNNRIKTIIYTEQLKEK